MLQMKGLNGLYFDDIINNLIDADTRFSEVPQELQNAWKEGELDEFRDEEAEVFKYYDSCPNF